MKTSRQAAPPGRWIKILEGHKACQPHPLPPGIAWTPRETERRLGISYNTVMRAIEALEAGGVLAKVGDSKRNRVSCAPAILDILEEPARLVPKAASEIRRTIRC